MTKKEDIKRLKKEKRYDEIYMKYGYKEYKKNTPHSYRKKELKKLVREGKFEDIFNKYGRNTYENLLAKAKYDEIKEAKGELSAILWNIKRNMKLTALYLGIVSSAVTLTLPGMNAISAKENEIKYEKEIDGYDKKIKKYADEVNKSNLSDVQIFMKVMDDMWKQIKGYKSPELDLTGFMELDLANEDGYGVCRNMASDIARKLNEINPEYNARTMVVNMGDNGSYKTADIKREILEKNETVQENQGNQEEENIGNMTAKIFGNHMVTLVDVKQDDLIIVLDPTNPGIGVYKDGNIKMLNSGKNNGLEFDTRKMTTIITSTGYRDGVECIEDLAMSYKKTKLTDEQIEEKYGLKAQNQALDEVREIESSKKSFKEGLKVDKLSKKEKSIQTNDDEKDITR